MTFLNHLISFVESETLHLLHKKFILAKVWVPDTLWTEGWDAELQFARGGSETPLKPSQSIGT